MQAQSNIFRFVYLNMHMEYLVEDISAVIELLMSQYSVFTQHPNSKGVYTFITKRETASRESSATVWWHFVGSCKTKTRPAS